MPHAHIHLIPMDNEGDVDFHKKGIIFSEEEFTAIAERIHSEFMKL